MLYIKLISDVVEQRIC